MTHYSFEKTMRLSMIGLLVLLSQINTVMAQDEVPPPASQLTEEAVLATYVNEPTNSHWEKLKFDPTIYNTPYKVSLFSPQNGENSQRLWSQSKSMFAYGFGVAGVIALLPDDISGWDKETAKPLKKWGDNVSQGMVWDRDVWYINYIGHPYFGGVYYQAARKSGYRQWDAFFYSFMMSTFYWEYGLEAFAEIPAIQDLVITPVLGWVYGEWAFNKEQEIRARGGLVGGSRFWGNTALFMLDPVDSLGVGINKLFKRQIITAGTGTIYYSDVPLDNQEGSPTEKQMGVRVQYALGQGYNSTGYKPRTAHVDPVTTGIVGMSLGVGSISLDDKWGLEDGVLPEWTLGLYFTPKFSMRLKYSQTKLRGKASDLEVTYENYSFNGQYYFNEKSKTRPFISAGVGEEMFEKDRKKKDVLWNLGLGVHHKLTNKWGVQGDWVHYYSPSEKTYETSINARLVYRFGQGDIKEIFSHK